MSTVAKLCFITVVTLCVLLTLSVTSARAAVPDSINYQGILKTPGGTPVPDGSYSVRFKIYDVASGPNPALWTEVKSINTVGGLFTTLLGSVTPLPPSILSGPQRFLGISVSPDAEMTPRVALVSVPYSHRVGTVDGSAGGTIAGDLTVSSGDVALDNSTATAGNILKGGVYFIHNYGTDNAFIGAAAGNLTMSGTDNTACGDGALGVNTTGNYNTAVGSAALNDNTTGTDNTACGVAALIYNTVGSRNTATGRSALRNNTTGDDNTAGGWDALNGNTSGNSNTALGRAALFSNDTGDSNTAIGRHALFSNTTGSNNTATGISALLSNTTGFYNTATGGAALLYNTTGHENAALGNHALFSNTTGYYNTASGNYALYTNSYGGSNTASGAAALFSNTGGYYNTASGYDALFSNISGSFNTAIGQSTLWTNTTGSHNTALGDGAGVSTGTLTNATAVGSGAVVNASNKIRLGNTDVTVIEGQVAYTFPSDSTKKENFRPVNGNEVLRKISEFNLRSWNYIGNDPQQFRHYGPMAQEFFAAFGHDGVGTSGTPTTINSGDEAGILMIAIQALEKRNEASKAENQSLQAQIAELREMIRAQASKQK